MNNNSFELLDVSAASLMGQVLPFTTRLVTCTQLPCLPTAGNSSFPLQ